MVKLPMLWISLRWNWGNLLAIAAFCLLSMLGAVNNAFVFSDPDDAEPGKALACIKLCDTYSQLSIDATRADVAPAPIALLHPQAFVFE